MNSYALGPDCGGRTQRGLIYFFTQITSEHQCSLRIQTHDAIASHARVRQFRIRRGIWRLRSVRSV